MAKNHTKIDDQMISISSDIKRSLHREFVTYCNIKETKPAIVIRDLVTGWVENIRATIRFDDPEKAIEVPMTVGQSNTIDYICDVHGIAKPNTNGWTFSQANVWIQNTNNKTGYKKK